jgi:FAD/FMN-containing dehydrogenase/Fe-S oxidoreductase
LVAKRELDLQTLANELRSAVTGEVRFDDVSRLIYATDASIYQIVPIGVIVPRTEADVRRTVQIAARHGVPVLPRGSGTSLAGQTVGAALVIDFTKYLNQILELNVAERWVRVQPGVILDELNAFLQPHGLLFPPDVATSNRASIGGMMGNNSCGAHSILYGRTVDHVLEQRVVLSDGSLAHFSPLSREEWDRRAAPDTLEGRIYREVTRICTAYAADVEAGFPRIMRRVGGYNLDEIVRHRRLNLAALAVGSEGTLVTVTEAKLNLVPVPRHAGLLISHFDDLLASLRAVPEIVALQPSSVELIDRIILDLTRDNLDLAPARSFLIGDPEAVLATEFYGDSAEEVADRLLMLQQTLERVGHGYAHAMLTSPPDKKKVWDVRNAGLGLLMGMKGDIKPAGFVEDTAVPVEVLAEYIGEFRSLLAEYDLTACYYAHASVGCLHARPILNLKTHMDQHRMREIAARVADLVLRYGGTMSAEHGDGIARSEWQEKMFGASLYRAFQELKRAFDPLGIMNPGKIVDSPPMNSHLRFGGDYRAAQVDTILDFSKDGGFAGAVEMCSGVGACRKNQDGTMCPSFRATREEVHSTRGRANLLRMVLSGQANLTGRGPGGQGSAPPQPQLPAETTPPLTNGGVGGVSPAPTTGVQGAAQGSDTASGPPVVRGGAAGTHPALPVITDPLADQRIHEVLDLCLECKACKSECPSNVDMAKLKYEFLSHYHQAHGTPLRARLFANVAQASRAGSFAASMANWLQERPFIRGLMDSQLGIDRRRPLPKYAEITFDTWWQARGGARGDGEEVVFFADTFARYQEPEVAMAAVHVLEAFGYRIRVPNVKCCGRPMISKGLLREARANAEYNVQQLAPLVRQGLPIIGLEPSCLVTLLDEYREFRLGEAANEVAANAWMLEDFLAAHHAGDEMLPYGQTPRRVLVHGHCHQKALLGTSRMLQALRMVPGYQVEEIKSGCCGMAGTFGYEKEHYELSLRIGELSVFPPVRAAAEDTLIVAPGTSCRHQIQDGTGRTAVHPAQALAAALVEEPV